MLVELREPESAGQMCRVLVFDDHGVAAPTWDVAVNSKTARPMLIGFEDPSRNREVIEQFVQRIARFEPFHYDDGASV